MWYWQVPVLRQGFYSFYTHHQGGLASQTLVQFINKSLLWEPHFTFFSSNLNGQMTILICGSRQSAVSNNLKQNWTQLVIILFKLGYKPRVTWWILITEMFNNSRFLGYVLQIANQTLTMCCQVAFNYLTSSPKGKIIIVYLIKTLKIWNNFFGQETLEEWFLLLLQECISNQWWVPNIVLNCASNNLEYLPRNKAKTNKYYCVDLHNVERTCVALLRVFALVSLDRILFGIQKSSPEVPTCKVLLHKLG